MASGGSLPQQANHVADFFQGKSITDFQQNVGLQSIEYVRILNQTLALI